jgi:hypothetical protein
LKVKIAGEEERRNMAFELKDRLKDEGRRTKEIVESYNKLKESCRCDRYRDLIRDYEII